MCVNKPTVRSFVISGSLYFQSIWQHLMVPGLMLLYYVLHLAHCSGCRLLFHANNLYFLDNVNGIETSVALIDSI